MAPSVPPPRDPEYRDLLDRVKGILAALPRLDLEELRDHLDDLLPGEREVERAHAVALADGGRDTGRPRTRRREWVRCGKEGCKCREKDGRHGPYLYEYWREGGRVRKRYVGKG